MSESLFEQVTRQVRQAGRDKYNRMQWRFGTTGKIYTGRNARDKAIKQGIAIMKAAGLGTNK